MPFAAIAWPVIALLVALVFIAQDLLIGLLHVDAALALTAYRITAWSVAAIALALLILPPRRAAYGLGFVICAALMAWALYLQYGLDLEPCPLCVFQRVALIATGIVFLVEHSSL